MLAEIAVGGLSYWVFRKVGLEKAAAAICGAFVFVAVFAFPESRDTDTVFAYLVALWFVTLLGAADLISRWAGAGQWGSLIIASAVSIAFITALIVFENL